MGGTGKTVLTKQIVVACCRARLHELIETAVPFRFALAEVAPLLNEESDEWSPLRMCLNNIFGSGSVQALALEKAIAHSERILLVLDER